MYNESLESLNAVLSNDPASLFSLWNGFSVLLDVELLVSTGLFVSIDLKRKFCIRVKLSMLCFAAVVKVFWSAGVVVVVADVVVVVLLLKSLPIELDLII